MYSSRLQAQGNALEQSAKPEERPPLYASQEKVPNEAPGFVRPFKLQHARAVFRGKPLVLRGHYRQIGCVASVSPPIRVEADQISRDTLYVPSLISIRLR